MIKNCILDLSELKTVAHMHVNINGNTVNLRLTPLELKKFNEEGYISTSLLSKECPSEKIIYSIEWSPSSNLEVTFAMNHFRIMVPNRLGIEWINSNIDHLEYFVKLDRLNYIRILVCKEERQISPSAVEVNRQELLQYLTYVN